MADEGLIEMFVERLGYSRVWGYQVERGCVSVSAGRWLDLIDGCCGGIDAVMGISFW